MSGVHRIRLYGRRGNRTVETYILLVENGEKDELIVKTRAASDSIMPGNIERI